MREDFDDILESMDGVESSKPSPFFYSRLMARIERAKKEQVQLRWAIATLVVLLTVNLALFGLMDSTVSDVGQTVTIDQVYDTDQDIYSILDNYEAK